MVRSAAASADSALASRSSSPERLLRIAREYDGKGRLEEAAEAYHAAIDAAEAVADTALVAEGLRRFAVLRHRQQACETARELCARSEAVARAAGQDGLVAEALNTFGGFEMVEGLLDHAAEYFLQAEALARDPDLRGRVEQNLGTIAGIQGRHDDALERYRRSLAGFLSAENDHGCAVAYHNLGAIYLDLQRWVEAERHFRLCLQSLDRSDDMHLCGLAVLNRAEALLALGRTREARLAAETGANIFDEMHAPRELAEAYRVLGTVLRHEGELRRALGKLQLAIEVAASAGNELAGAESSRELALVLALLGRPGEAWSVMAQAAPALDRLKPVGGSTEAVGAGEYPAGVRARGELLGITDPTALAHAERVACRAAALARALGYDANSVARIRVGAYLHEHDPANLGDALPWDVRPILRWHLERRDGSGPAGLRGEDIPLDAEIVGIADAHDAGTVLENELARCWRADVARAFRESDRHADEVAMLEARESRASRNEPASGCCSGEIVPGRVDTKRSDTLGAVSDLRVAPPGLEPGLS